jgi:WD40 repeat protein
VAELVDLAINRVVTTFNGHQGRVFGIALTPDARVIASLATDNIIRVWDGRMARELGQFRGTWEAYQAVALSPDGSRLGGGGEGVDIWDLVTQRLVQTFSTAPERVTSLAWTPGMLQLTTVSFQNVRAWRSETFAQTVATGQ